METSGKNHFQISTNALSAEAAMAFIADPAHGAADVFIGSVRDFNMGQTVRGISYDVYDELALQVFQDLAHRARDQWGQKLHIFIEHFKGRLDVGGLSIVIAVSSPHRDESFKACRFLIEEIKHRAPVWKQEHYCNGDSQWVQGHALCSHGSHEHTEHH